MLDPVFRLWMVFFWLAALVVLLIFFGNKPRT